MHSYMIEWGRKEQNPGALIPTSAYNFLWANRMVLGMFSDSFTHNKMQNILLKDSYMQYLELFKVIYPY